MSPIRARGLPHPHPCPQAGDLVGRLQSERQADAAAMDDEVKQLREEHERQVRGGAADTATTTTAAATTALLLLLLSLVVTTLVCTATGLASC
jgi:hypothetical protein